MLISRDRQSPLTPTLSHWEREPYGAEIRYGSQSVAPYQSLAHFVLSFEKVTDPFFTLL